jgi:arylsulfatase
MLDGFDQRDYLEGNTDKSAREVFYYFSGATPSAVRFHNWKMYYKVAQPGPGGWLESLESWHFPLIQNIKRDPFEQNVAPNNTKSLLYFGGTLTAPSTAYMYDGLGIMPLGQQLWLEKLQSLVTFPPLQSPETYNLGQVIQEIKSQRHITPAGD